MRGETFQQLAHDADLEKVRDVYTATVGAGGLLAAAAITTYSFWRPPRSRLAYLALGLILFSATSGFIVTVGRLFFFLAYPNQVMADRYLIWSMLLWSGLIVLVLVALARYSRFRLVAMGTSILLTASIAYGTTSSEEEWLHYRGNFVATSRNCLLSAQLRIHHPSVLRSCGVYFSVSQLLEPFYKTLHSLQAKKLGGFAKTHDDVLGKNVFRLFRRTNKSALIGRMEMAPLIRDKNTRGAVAPITGWSADRESGRPPERIFVVDRKNRIVGIAQPESIDIAEARRRGWPPLTRFRFGGFVMGYEARERYLVVAVEGTQASVMGELARSSGGVSNHDVADQ